MGVKRDLLHRQRNMGWVVKKSVLRRKF